MICLTNWTIGANSFEISVYQLWEGSFTYHTKPYHNCIEGCQLMAVALMVTTRSPIDVLSTVETRIIIVVVVIIEKQGHRSLQSNLHPPYFPESNLAPQNVGSVLE